MIAIVNQGYSWTNQKHDDECYYHVKINQEFICEFKHNRGDGLAVCLDKAAKAVRKYKKRRINDNQDIIERDGEVRP